MGRSFGGLLRKLLRIDADRKYCGVRAAVLRGHDTLVDGEPEIALNVRQEVLAILLGLETDEVIGQHRLDQFAMMRHATNHVARRPRRMQEEADRLRDAEFAQFRAEREEVIILNPESGVGFAESQQRTRHKSVHFAIALIVVLGRADQIGARMQRRPQGRIRKTFVVAAIMRGRQIEHRQRTGAQGFNLGKRLLRVPVANTSAGTDPYCAGFLDNRQQRGCSPPVMGSLGLPRATRFETTTRFTGPLLLSTRSLTTIHQYGSWPSFQRIETKFGLERGELTKPHEKENFSREVHDARRTGSKIGLAPKTRHHLWQRCVPFIVEQVRKKFPDVAR